ncbi:MAG: DUF3488 and transglutaminase-like domain-containing protein [Planctomycetota bacterium]
MASPRRQHGAGLLPACVLIIAGMTYQVSDPTSIIPILAAIACVTGRLLPRVLPDWRTPSVIIGIAVIAVVAYAAVSTLTQGADVAIFAHFMLLLGAVKCFEEHTARDDGQLLIVSIFIVLASVVNSNEFAVGVLTMLYLLLVILAAMHVQVAAVLPAPSTDTAIAATPVPSSRRMIGLAIGAFIWICGIGLVVFLVLPREFDSELLPGQEGPRTQRVAGFSEEVQLGEGGLISSDPTVVMTVKARRITQGRFRAYPDVNLWLRGVTLSEYVPSLGSWRNSPPPRAMQEDETVFPGFSRRFGSVMVKERDATIVELEIEQFGGASEQNTLFSLLSPKKITFLDAEGDFKHDTRDNTLRLLGESDPGITYVVRSQIPSLDLPDGRPARSTHRSFVGAPSGYASIARGVLRQAGLDPDASTHDPADDDEVMRLLTNWLRSQHAYTLDIQAAPEGVDPTLWFLEAGVAGHCEYFASALALLGRSVGVPTRVVTGYLVNEYDRASGEGLVRRSDAHAWVEALVGPDAWRTFDATPPASLRDSARADIGPIVQWLSRLETAWLTSFVSFDSDHQRSVVSSIDALWQRVSGRFDAEERGSQPQNGAPRWIVLAAAVLAAGCVVVVVARSLSRRKRGVGLAAEILDARRQLERAWHRAGVPRPPATPLVAHAADIRDTPALRLAHAIEYAAFGPRGRAGNAMLELKNALDRWSTATGNKTRSG